MKCAKVVLAWVLAAAFSSPLLAQAPPSNTVCPSSPNITLETPVLLGTVPGGSGNVNTAKLLAVMSQGSPDFVAVTAHRGDWFSCPEDSLPAIQQAINDGVESIEIDLRFAADKTLVASHDVDLIKETNWSLSNGPGQVKTLTWDQIASLTLRDRKGNLQSGNGLRVLRFEDVLTLWNQNNFGSRGPVLTIDLKDASTDPTGQGLTIWNAYKAAVALVQSMLPSSAQPAIVFKLKLQDLPMTGSDTLLAACAAHPGYGHIVAIAHDQDASDPNWNPSGAYFSQVLNLSSQNGTCQGINAPNFIQQIEIGIKNPKSPAVNFLPTRVGVSSYASYSVFRQHYFYPEGVSTIYGGPNDTRVFNPGLPAGTQQGQTFCCFRQDIAATDSQGNLNSDQDLRGDLAFPFSTPDTLSSITSDNLPMTLSWLTNIGKRNVTKIQ